MTALLASAWAYLCAVLAWIQANPTLAWPIITAIVTFALKPRTPEAYARLASRNPVWLFARLAAVLQLIGALGLDPVKAMAAIRKLPTGKSDPPPPPAGPSVLPVLLLVGLLGLGADACRPGETPRETARATVLVLADALKQLDGACAKMATAKHDHDLAVRCADGYDAARPALLAAESAVDAYDSGAAGELPCAVARAANAVQFMSEAITAAGGKPPPVVDDALRLSPLLAAGCRG